VRITAPFERFECLARAGELVCDDAQVRWCRPLGLGRTASETPPPDGGAAR
jgi:hypothetical protein